MGNNNLLPAKTCIRQPTSDAIIRIIQMGSTTAFRRWSFDTKESKKSRIQVFLLAGPVSLKKKDSINATRMPYSRGVKPAW